MYSAVSVRGVWVWVEGGVAAKCWRPPIFPARWLKKWLLLTGITRKFVFLLRAGNEINLNTGPILRKTAGSLFKFSHLFSKITRKWVHKLISNNNHIWGCHPTTTSFTQRPSVSPPATTNSIYNSVWWGENWDPPFPERVALFACPDRTSHGDSILNMNQIKSETGFKIRCALKMLNFFWLRCSLKL